MRITRIFLVGVVLINCGCNHKRPDPVAAEQMLQAKEFRDINQKVFGGLKFYQERISFGAVVQRDGSLVVMPPGGSVLADRNKPLFNMQAEYRDAGAVWRMHVKKEGEGWRLKFSEAGATKSVRSSDISYEPHWPYWEASRRIYLEKLREAGVVIYADEPNDAEKAKDPVRQYLTLSLSMLSHEPP